MTPTEIEDRVDQLMAAFNAEFSPIALEFAKRLHDVPPQIALFLVLRQTTASVLARVHPSQRTTIAEALADEIAQDARDSLQ